MDHNKEEAIKEYIKWSHGRLTAEDYEKAIKALKAANVPEPYTWYESSECQI